MRDIECIACGCEEISRFKFIEEHSVEYNGETLSYSIYRCSLCACEFADPMKPAPPEWYHHVKEYYGWRWEFDEFIKSLGSKGDKRTILEIACGEGIVLDRLRERYDVCGMDFNVKAIEKARSKGIEVYSSTLEQFSVDFPERKFDAIAFFQVLEHIEEPVAFLSSIKKMLNKGGLIFLSIPNPERIDLAIAREWWDYPPHHLMRYSKQGLLILLGRAGFEVSFVKARPVDTAYMLASKYSNIRIKELLKVDVNTLLKYQRVFLKLFFFVRLYPKFLYLTRRMTGQDVFIVARHAS